MEIVAMSQYLLDYTQAQHLHSSFAAHRYRQPSHAYNNIKHSLGRLKHAKHLKLKSLAPRLLPGSHGCSLRTCSHATSRSSTSYEHETQRAWSFWKGYWQKDMMLVNAIRPINQNWQTWNTGRHPLHLGWNGCDAGIKTCNGCNVNMIVYN